MDLLAQTLSNNADSILIKEILKVFSELQCGNKIVDILQNLSKGVARLVVIFCIQYHFKNPGNANGFLLTILRHFLYKNLRFNMSEISEEFCVAKRLKETVTTNHSFQVYYHEEGDQAVFKMIPFVHRRLYLEALESGKKDYQVHLQKQSKGSTICKTLNGSFNPKTLFPSKNYTRLLRILQNHFEVSKLTKSFRTLGILLDGEPGLGKTDCLDFLATSRVCGEVVKIDMTKMLGTEFASIVKSAFSGRRPKELVILFDELDKYIDYQVRKEYRKYSMECEGKEKGHISPEEFTVHFKQDFLYDLLSLLESTQHTHGLVILFCSNNFDTIFEGVEPTHFCSLKKRFVRITFERCDSLELKDYLRYLNGRFEGTKWYHSHEELEEELKLVKEDLSVPYRELCHLHITSCYNTHDFIAALNEWTDEEGPAPVQRLCEVKPWLLDTETPSVLTGFSLKSSEKAVENKNPSTPSTSSSKGKERLPTSLIAMPSTAIPQEHLLRPPTKCIESDTDEDDTETEYGSEDDQDHLSPIKFDIGTPTSFSVEDPNLVHKQKCVSDLKSLINKKIVSAEDILGTLTYMIDNERGISELMKNERFRETIKHKLREFENSPGVPEYLKADQDRIHGILRQRYPFLY